MAETKVTRNSKQRTAVLEALAETTSHPTAEWVYQEVSRKIPNISLGTVYRNLSQLAEVARKFHSLLQKHYERCKILLVMSYEGHNNTKFQSNNR